MKHGLDHFSNSIGFHRGKENVGSNEGATQRFATDIAEEMLGIQIPETSQSSLGIAIQTNLDEYQIEDKLNELFCKAMGISRSEFLRAQNEESQQAFNMIIQNFNKYASYTTFQQALDGIYHIQEETWVDENGNLLEEEAKPTPEQTQRATELIKICQEQTVQYIKQTNPELLNEIKGEFIMPMNEYGEIVREENTDVTPDTVLQTETTLTDSEMLYQADYMKYQEFLLNGVDLKDNTVVFISGLGGHTFEKIDDIYPPIQQELEDQDKKLTESLFVRSGDIYKVANITFGRNGTFNISDYEEIDTLSTILEHIEHSEVIGNAPEYIKLLKLQGNDLKANEIEGKYKYWLENQSRLEEIKQKPTEKSAQGLEIEALMQQMYDGEISVLSAGEESDKFDYYEVDRFGVAILTEDLKETAEDPQSIEARKKVLADLTQAQTNERTQENQQEQGE